MNEFSKCARCGMNLLSATDYHPFAACVMFQGLKDGDRVEANIKAVIEYGMKAQAAGISAEQAMRDIRLGR
jgi:hypothetical protein